MKLIGMLDSPYVRRVAICFDYMNIPFEHKAISVFRSYEEFKHINPVVKAPTLQLDDGQILMDSGVILDYVQSLRQSTVALWSDDTKQRLKQSQVLCNALAICDKSVQLIYETNLRPPEAQYQPWLTRVRGQIKEALIVLEGLIGKGQDAAPNHGNIMAAITYQFCHSMIPEICSAQAYPNLRLLSEQMEKEHSFLAYPPDGPGVPSSGL